MVRHGEDIRFIRGGYQYPSGAAYGSAGGNYTSHFATHLPSAIHRGTRVVTEKHVWPHTGIRDGSFNGSSLRSVGDYYTAW